MIAVAEIEIPKGRVTALARRALFCAGLLAASVAFAGAQEQQRQKAGEPPPPSGMFESVGRWFDEAWSSIGSNFSSARSRVDNFGDEAGEAARATANAAKDAATAVTRLPGARVVKGHQNCATAANGAPDCVVAANAMCKAKGFNAGRSVDITSAEECPAPVMLGRREAKPGECRTVTFVTSAFCQ
jgi:hypothetical protein